MMKRGLINGYKKNIKKIIRKQIFKGHLNPVFNAI